MNAKVVPKDQVEETMAVVAGNDIFKAMICDWPLPNISTHRMEDLTDRITALVEILLGAGADYKELCSALEGVSSDLTKRRLKAERAAGTRF